MTAADITDGRSRLKMSKFKEKVGGFFGGEKFSSGMLTVILIGLVIVVNVIVYVLDVYFGLFLYKPDTDDLTISGAAEQMFAEPFGEGKEVTVMFCQPRDDMAVHTTGSLVLNTAEQLKEKFPDNIKLEFINILTQMKPDGKGGYEYIDLTPFRDANGDGELETLLSSSVIFICDNNFKVITDNYSTAGYADFFTLSSSGTPMSYNGEEMLCAMISWVMHDEHKTAYFTTYHGETADIGFRNMLTASGYNIDTIDLREKEIPADAELVVISNPQQDFERAAANSTVRTEIERLRTFMERGGNLFVALDPYVEKLHVLEEFVAEYGISVSETKTESGLLRNIIRDSNNAITADFFTLVADYPDNDVASTIKQTVAKYNTASVIVRENAALSLSGELAKPLLLSSPSSALYAGADVVDNGGSYCIAATSSVDASEGAGKIFVVPGVYLTATDTLITGGYANREFLFALIDEVYGKENLPYGCKTVYYTTSEVLENLTMGTARVYTVLILAVPAALAVVGAVIIRKRKNR